jgi:hypothetical protein
VANEITLLVKRVNDSILDDKNLRTALISTLPAHKQRIFERGQTATGGQIGTYGTNPISISKKSQARNTGKTYFAGGYAEYKTAIGKNPGRVILRNTDQMYIDYGLQGSANNYGYGFQNSVNADKSGWMEDKYKVEIFSLSDKELNDFGTLLFNLQMKNV